MDEFQEMAQTIRELEEENAALTAERDALAEAIYSLQPRPDRRHWDCPFCHQRTMQEEPAINHKPDCFWLMARTISKKRIEAFLTPAPAEPAEMVMVRRADLEAAIAVWENQYSLKDDEDKRILSRLKAALTPADSGKE